MTGSKEDKAVPTDKTPGTLAQSRGQGFAFGLESYTRRQKEAWAGLRGFKFPLSWVMGLLNAFPSDLIHQSHGCAATLKGEITSFRILSTHRQLPGKVITIWELIRMTLWTFQKGTQI